MKGMTMEQKKYPSKREEKGWYRKSPSWKFWDRKDYAMLECPHDGCDFGVEIHSPYTGSFTSMSWKIQVLNHMTFCEHAPKEKKKVKKAAKKSAAKKAAKKVVKKVAKKAPAKKKPVVAKWKTDKKKAKKK